MKNASDKCRQALVGLAIDWRGLDAQLQCVTMDAYDSGG